MPEPFSVLTTPPGVGAIAVIEVIGPDAFATVRGLFRGTIREAGQLSHGRLRIEETEIDEVLLRVVPAAKSFTGFDTVEISCHGGAMTTQGIFEALARRSILRREWPAIVDAAVRNRRIDAVQAEAYRALPEARTRRAAAMLNDQARGALSSHIATLDASALLATAPYGQALVEPRRIVIVGRPNAGKSTLFNALVGRERAVVYPQAGTTRDPVEETITLEGIPFLLADTAGVREPQDFLEQQSIERTQAAISSADLLLFVFDGLLGVSDPERELLAGLRGRAVLPLLNKGDLARKNGNLDALPISALRGDGIEKVRQAIPARLGLHPVPSGAPVVFTRRQVEILKQAPVGGPIPAPFVRELLESPFALC